MTHVIRDVASDVDAIVQLGDFGWFPDTSWGIEFIAAIATQAKRRRVHVHFIDGNHEDFGDLFFMKEVPEEADDVTPEGFIRLRSHLNYIPRGTRWEWDGVSFLALGGAYSIDKDGRIEGRSWWPQEDITDDDVRRCGADPVEVMLTHEAPMGALDTPSFESVPMKAHARASEANRIKIRNVMNDCRPRLLVHAHHHHRYETVVGLTRVIGLAGECDNALYRFDTDDLRS
ncbi:MAG: hypothetical protein GEU78_13740 [Actinobacteria bacterium]|nr:hypothetical protein [Actinomycetota bacterium]